MVWWTARLLRSPEIDRKRFDWCLLPALALVIGSLNCTALGAEISGQCPLDNLDECTLVVQIASLRAASQELDPALRSIVFGKALKSNDLRLRTAGLRYVLASRTTFNVVVEPPVHPTSAQQKVYQQYASLTLQSVKLDEKTDEITAFIFNNNKITGSIIWGGFEFGWPNCRLHMAAGEEDALKGTLRCQYSDAEPAELKVSIELS